MLLPVELIRRILLIRRLMSWRHYVRSITPRLESVLGIQVAQDIESPFNADEQYHYVRLGWHNTMAYEIYENTELILAVNDETTTPAIVQIVTYPTGKIKYYLVE